MAWKRSGLILKRKDKGEINKKEKYKQEKGSKLQEAKKQVIRETNTQIIYTAPEFTMSSRAH